MPFYTNALLVTRWLFVQTDSESVLYDKQRSSEPARLASGISVAKEIICMRAKIQKTVKLYLLPCHFFFFSKSEEVVSKEK